MKRLALLLATSLLGTGCYVAPCTPSATLDWSSGFLGADGVVRSCAGAGVTFVDTFINGDANTAARFPCTQLGAQAVNVPGGTNLYTVEGVDGSGRILFRAEASVASTCADQAIPVTPAQGTLAVDYTFSPANVCFSPQPTYMWTEVHDDIAGQTAFVDTGTGPANLCSTTAAAPQYLLPAGSFTLVGMNEYSPGPPAGVVAADCTHRPFDVAGAAVTTVSPVLVDSSAACF